jgi:hypothetical protein
MPETPSDHQPYEPPTLTEHCDYTTATGGSNGVDLPFDGLGLNGGEQ